MEIDGKNVKIAFTIKGVESIPCDLRGQTVAFDENGKQVTQPLKTPWPMPWVTEEITKYAAGGYEMPEEEKFRIYNPEEPDQFVYVSVEKYE